MESVRAECYFQYDPEAIRDQPPRRGSWIKYWRAIVDSNHITSLHHITICTGTAQGDIDFFVRSEEHTSELQSLMRISYAVFCLKKKTHNTHKYLLNNTTLNTR